MTTKYQFTHDDRFVVFPDVTVVDDKLVPKNPSESDVVEAPQCGFWTVAWAATHPQHGGHTGVMFVARNHDKDYARNVVSEILWGRGFTGNYTVEAV